MELILGLATILEVMVVGVLVMALWQDRRHDVAKRDWEDDRASLARGEDPSAQTQ